MNYAAMLEKTTDFLINFAVASFAVAFFEKSGGYYGYFLGLSAYMLSMFFASKIGGHK